MTIATLAKHLITVEEFLDMKFDTEERYELDNGVVRMMGGGTVRYSEIQGNVLLALKQKLKGSDCAPHGPDMGARNHRLSLRYPDVSVYCGRRGPEDDKLKALDDPKLVVEIFSPTTRTRDIEVKLPEYRSVSSLMAILYVDPEDETVHLEVRDDAGEWSVASIPADGAIDLPFFGIALSHDDVFARA